MGDHESDQDANQLRFIEVVQRAQQLFAQMEAVVSQERGCNQIFSVFNEIKDIINELEELLMTLRLNRCMLPEFDSNKEIIDAVMTMATKRQGALIAIEKQQDLSELITASEQGTSLDANLTATLLEAIFYPGNPLHDGGVIISQNRLIAAGCVFPLSGKHLSKEHKNLGTRHRAALGLSEAYDASVLVVSEETGRISIANGGKLYKITSACDLHHRIVTLGGVDTTKRPLFCDSKL